MEIRPDTLQYMSIELDYERAAVFSLLASRLFGSHTITRGFSSYPFCIDESDKTKMMLWLTAEEAQKIRELFFLNGLGDIEFVPAYEE